VVSDLGDSLHAGIRVGFERTSEQDAALGVRQLADIASKALSPAINDPYTAQQAVDHLSVIVCALARHPLGNQVLKDSEGATRVLLPARDLAYFLDLACGQVRRYGKSEPRVMGALLRFLDNVGGVCVDERSRADVAYQVRLVLDAAEAAVQQPEDLAPVRQKGEEVLRAVTG
jgi:uncharacterized membrane protein